MYHHATRTLTDNTDNTKFTCVDLAHNHKSIERNITHHTQRFLDKTIPFHINAPTSTSTSTSNNNAYSY